MDTSGERVHLCVQEEAGLCREVADNATVTAKFLDSYQAAASPAGFYGLQDVVK